MLPVVEMQFQFLLLLFLENIFEKQIFEGGFIALPGKRGDITEAILAMPNWIDILVSIITSTENLIFDINLNKKLEDSCPNVTPNTDSNEVGHVMDVDTACSLLIDPEHSIEAKLGAINAIGNLYYYIILFYVIE